MSGWVLNQTVPMNTNEFFQNHINLRNVAGTGSYEDEIEITAMWKFRISCCRARMRRPATSGGSNILSNMLLESCGLIPKKSVLLPHIWNRLVCSRAVKGLSTKFRLYFMSSLESLWGFITFRLRIVMKKES